MWNKIWSTKTFIIIRSIGTANGGQSVVHLHAENKRFDCYHAKNFSNRLQ